MFDPFFGREEVNYYLLTDKNGSPIRAFSVPTSEVESDGLNEAIKTAEGEGSKILWRLLLVECGSLGDLTRRIKERDYRP